MMINVKKKKKKESKEGVATSDRAVWVETECDDKACLSLLHRGSQQQSGASPIKHQIPRGWVDDVDKGMNVDFRSI